MRHVRQNRPRKWQIWLLPVFRTAACGCSEKSGQVASELVDTQTRIFALSRPACRHPRHDARNVCQNLLKRDRLTYDWSSPRCLTRLRFS